MDIASQFIKLITISSPSGHEQEVSLFLQEWLNANAFTVQLDSVGNILGKNNKKGQSLLLCAHMDTVSPGVNIQPHITDGLIQSDGTTILGADNKAAIAAIMAAVESAAERNLEILFTVKEEVGGGVDNIPQEWISSTNALIFDSAKPLGGIVLSSPFITNFSVSFQGKSAHSSTPEQGINAFVPAASFLVQLPVGTLDDGATTVNVGMVNGGVGINTIPDLITIQGEIRSYNKHLFDTQIAQIKQMSELCGTKYHCMPNFKMSGFCAGYTHSKNDAFVRAIHIALEQLGFSPVYYTHSGISDANVLNAMGIKTVNLTDGVQYPHTKNEQITVKGLEKLAAVIKKCIQEL